MARQAGFQSCHLAHPDYWASLAAYAFPGLLRILVRYLRTLVTARDGWPPARAHVARWPVHLFLGG
jgi:hypothetical protein